MSDYSVPSLDVFLSWNLNVLLLAFVKDQLSLDQLANVNQSQEEKELVDHEYFAIHKETHLFNKLDRASIVNIFVLVDDNSNHTCTN